MREGILDTIDEQLIALLSENAKLNNKELAARVGLSVTPVFERVKRLERLQVILGYEARINPKMVGKELKIICQVSLNSHRKDGIEEFEEAVKQLAEVTEAYHVAGVVDYVLVVECADMDSYQYFLKNRLAHIPHIGQVNSSFVMTTLR